MPSVLHTNFLHGWGGQSNRILTECAGVAERGWNVVISAPADSQLIARAAAHGMRVESNIGYRGGLKRGALSDIRHMRALLRDLHPDIVHLHGGKDSWLLAQALMFPLRGVPRPIIVRTKHNVFPIKDHALNRWQYGRFFDSIVGISSAIMQQLREKPYIDERKLTLIPSAIDAERFVRPAGTRERMRAEFGFAPDQLVVGMTGRLRQEKGYDILIGAIPRVAASCPAARFLLVGGGSLEGELREQLARTGYADHVIMAGFREDIPDVLTAVDVYTQPSRSEGLGTSVLEAAAAALPIVASDTGGIPDIVLHEKTGLLVSPENSTALADAILRLLNSSDDRARLSLAAREHVANRYSIPALVSATDELYRSLLDSRKR